ncbi:hypothetical protein Dimus_009382 [Dionaea muscipula]
MAGRFPALSSTINRGDPGIQTEKTSGFNRGGNTAKPLPLSKRMRPVVKQVWIPRKERLNLSAKDSYANMVKNGSARQEDIPSIRIHSIGNGWLYRSAVATFADHRPTDYDENQDEGIWAPQAPENGVVSRLHIQDSFTGADITSAIAKRSEPGIHRLESARRFIAQYVFMIEVMRILVGGRSPIDDVAFSSWHRAIVPRVIQIGCSHSVALILFASGLFVYIDSGGVLVGLGSGWAGFKIHGRGVVRGEYCVLSVDIPVALRSNSWHDSGDLGSCAYLAGTGFGPRGFVHGSLDLFRRRRPYADGPFRIFYLVIGRLSSVLAPIYTSTSLSCADLRSSLDGLGWGASRELHV